MAQKVTRETCVEAFNYLKTMANETNRAGCYTLEESGRLFNAVTYLSNYFETGTIDNNMLKEQGEFLLNALNNACAKSGYQTCQQAAVTWNACQLFTNYMSAQLQQPKVVPQAKGKEPTQVLNITDN